MARMAQIDAGIPYTTPLQTLNRQCSFGLQAMNVIAIAADQITMGIGCGVESMSCHPMNKVTPPVVDWEVMKEDRNEVAMIFLIPMGITSENVSQTTPAILSKLKPVFDV